MIISKLIGGLGNQMFQYAAGKSLSVKHKVPLLLDCSGLEADPKGAYTKRNFELEAFKINASKASEKELAEFIPSGNRFITKLKQKFPVPFSRIIFNEHSHKFHNQFFSLPSDTYINGFWQNEKYFKDIRDILLSEFELKERLLAPHNTFITKITSSESIGVHVRRGDYVNSESANSFHGLCDLNYYNNAFEILKSKNYALNFFVFSDDISWCKENFSGNNFYFVETNSHPAVDLILMSRCSHQVIANSSFSWWAAWLNKNKTKTVVAPEFWFRKTKSVELGILPSDWQIIK